MLAFFPSLGLLFVSTSEDVSAKIDNVCLLQRENPILDGVLANTKYDGKRKYPDDKLRKLILISPILILRTYDNALFLYQFYNFCNLGIVNREIKNSTVAPIISKLTE
ncbi:MAG: hypothetical protein M3Y53_12110 [Thermoproteota archaeon]|nr:hypothetical protein [Thermoproteota archaeon]